jgi:hypothetical protein
MTDLSSISADSVGAANALADALPHDEPVALDPSDPTHLAAIHAALEAADRSADRYPALHAALPEAGGNPDNLLFVDKGRNRSGNATATSWQSAPQDTVYNGGTLFALDGGTGQLVGLGHNSAVRQGFLPVSTDLSSALPAGAALKLLAVHHSVSLSGEPQFTAMSSVATTAEVEMEEGLAMVTVPTSTPIHTNPTYVKIGVNRPNSPPPTDCDYYYSDNAVDNPYLIVPFTGTADLPYEIDGTLGQPIAGAVLLTQIYYQGGGQPIAMNTTYTKNFQATVQVSATDPYQVVWSYTYVGGQSYTNTTSIVYNSGPVNDLQYSYFYYHFEIPLKNAPTPTISFNVCSVDTPIEKTAQCTEIPDLMFTWHCLAGGTKIALSDGGGAAIEDVTGEHRVLTGEGKAHLGVEATTRGGHCSPADTSGPHAVYRLTTDEGHELTGCGRHLVQTPDGLVPLYDLAEGDKITTDGGSACVAECRAIDYDGMLYNLQLGDDGDRADGLAEGAVCTFVANGIVVGDALAQVNEHNRLSRDLDHMKSVLPEHLHDDYASALEDIRY